MGTRGSVEFEDRLLWLTNSANEQGRVDIAAAAERLGVSEMTIRRDLKELEERGVLRRIRGGALPIGPMAFASRDAMATKAKSRIADKVRPLLPAEGAIALDASSTMLRLTAGITEARNLVVVTNGPQTHTALNYAPGVRAVLTGGEADPRTGSLVGPVAARTVSMFAFSHFLTSAAAIDARIGTTESCLEEAEVKRAIVDVSEQVILAVDATKLETRAVATAIGWDHVDLLVTDLDPTDPRLDPYRDLVEIL